MVMCRSKKLKLNEETGKRVKEGLPTEIIDQKLNLHECISFFKLTMYHHFSLGLTGAKVAGVLSSIGLG